MPTLRAPERDEPPDPVDSDEYGWATGVEPSEAMAEKKATQETKHDATTSLPWYVRDYEAEETNLIGGTELNQLLDDFYGETAGKPDEKTPRKTSVLVERDRPELPSVLPYTHAILSKNSVPCNGRSVCASLDPTLYIKHPFSCGCNQGSRSAPAEITSMPSKSTTEARAHPWSCETQNKSPAGTPPFETEMAGRTSSARLETAFEYEDIERHGNFLPATRSVDPQTTRILAVQKPEASFDTNLQYQSPAPSEPDNTFNIHDWVHDQY